MFKFNEHHLAKPFYSAVVFNPRNPLYQNIKQEVQEEEKKEKIKPKFYQKQSTKSLTAKSTMPLAK
jgi:hypothetical protein